MRRGSEASWWRQLRTLTARSFINMCRDVGYYWTRIVSYIVVSISVGTIFYDVGYSYTSILARVSCGGFITGFMTFMSIGGFPSFLEEMKVKIINPNYISQILICYIDGYSQVKNCFKASKIFLSQYLLLKYIFTI